MANRPRVSKAARFLPYDIRNANPLKALVVGDTGMVGRYLVAHLLETADWSVCGLSRTGQSNDYVCLNADLTDSDAIARVVEGHSDISHVFYAGRAPDPDPKIECDNNTAMFINLVRSMDRVGVNYQHIQLMQGLKWYGSNAGPWRTPASEGDPRASGPNFYFDQHDWLLTHQQDKGFTWSAVRPHQVAGFSDTYPHNIAGVLALYGSFCKAHGKPLDFPGNAACYDSVSMLMDAALMADNMVFIATSPTTCNQAFNIGNGDYFRWRNLWPRLAEFFDVPCGEVTDISLAQTYGSRGNEWRVMCGQHGLAVSDMERIGNWHYGDFSFRAGWDDMASLNAIRAAGYHGWLDTEKGLLQTLAQYRAAKIIP